MGDIDIKELIDHYKQYDCLWNLNSADFNNKSSVDIALEDIANYFQKDVSQVKRKIKYLRAAYDAERKKVIASRKSGGRSQYKPSLFYYKDLNFLDNEEEECIFGNEQTEIEFENVEISPEADISKDVDYKEIEFNCKSESYADSDTEPMPPQIPKRVVTRVSHARPITSQALKRRVTGEIKTNNAVYSNVPVSSSSVSNSPKKSLYISFGKTIALQLQQMPLEAAIIAMSEIHTILTKKTLEHIRSLKNGHESSQPESEDIYTELIEETLID